MHAFTAVMGLVVFGAVACLPGAANAQVYRCGQTYTDTPCEGAQSVELQPPVQSHDSPNRSNVFLCRLAERQFWSAQSCQSHNATMLRSQPVPPHWTWEQQWQHAEREWRRAEQRTAVQAPLNHHADTSTQAQRQRARPDCASYAQRIRQLDEMGRRGGSARYMDRLRHERQQVRDTQYRVGC